MTLVNDRRRFVRRRSPLPYLSKSREAEYWSNRFRITRQYLPTACVAICRSARMKPTDENMRKARQTLYRWARARAVTWECTLIEALEMVVCAASVLGLPLVEWDYNKAGNKFPVFKWPQYKGQNQWHAVMKEWNRVCQSHMESLWKWYDNERRL